MNETQQIFLALLQGLGFTAGLFLLVIIGVWVMSSSDPYPPADPLDDEEINRIVNRIMKSRE